MLLHNFADLDGRIEELGGTAIQADGFALVELAFTVFGGDALLLASILETTRFTHANVSESTFFPSHSVRD